MKKQFRSIFWNGISLAVEQVTPAFDIRWHDNIGIQLDTTGVTTNTGTFYVEATNQNPFNADGSQVSSVISWEALDVEPVNTLTNTDAKFRINANQVPFGFIRVHFVPAGDTPNGTVIGILVAKGI